MKKGFFSFAGRRLVSGPRPKPAQPASHRAACLTSAQPSPAPRLACLRARLLADAPRRARPRQSSPAAWRSCTVDAATHRSWPAPAPTRPPTSAEAGALTCSLSRCLSSPLASSSLSPPRRGHRAIPAAAGRIRRPSSTSASNRAPAVPPRSPARGARAWADRSSSGSAF